MAMRHIGITAFFAAVIVGMPLLPVLAQDKADHQMMMMGGMMETCKKHCDTTSATMADLTKTIAAARVSNDVKKLHEALDQVQAGMVKMETEMTDCHDMMQKMMHHQ
jgi:hypothetical protein